MPTPSPLTSTDAQSVPDSLSSLRYDYSLDSFDESSHYGRLLSRVGRHKRVLELGSSTGFITAALIEQFACSVVGVEVDEDAARVARGKGHEVFVLDLDKEDLAKVFAGRQFDVVLCADVLEHLRDPGSTLKQLRALLAADGYVICSIPHVAHADIKLSLLSGRLPYRPAGLLDHTHMKFFTRALLEEVFEGAGMQVLQVERNRWQATRTEVQGRMPAALAGISDYLAADPESETYQFIVKAAPYALPQNSAPTARVDVVVIDQDGAVADDLYQKYLTIMRYPADLLRFWFVSEGGGLTLASKPKGEAIAFSDSDFRTFRFAAGSVQGRDPQAAVPAAVNLPHINRRAPGVNIATSLTQVAQGSDAKYLFVLLANALPGANCLAELVKAAEAAELACKKNLRKSMLNAPLLAATPELRAATDPEPSQKPPATGPNPTEADCLPPQCAPIAWHGFSGILIPRDFLLELKSIDPNLWTVQAQAVDMCFRAWACDRQVLECASANYFSNGPTHLPGDYDDTVADGLRLRRRWGSLRNIIAYARYAIKQYGAGRALVAVKTLNHVVAALMIETPLRGALPEEALSLVGFTGAGASVIGRP